MTAFVLAVGLTVPAPAAWWPLAVGHAWRYQVDSIDDPKYDVVTTVAERKAVGGVVRFKLSSGVAASNDGKPIAHEWVSVRADGVYRDTDGDREFDPPFRVLSAAPRPGDAWEQASTFRGDRWLYVHRVARQTVRVPAGKYENAVLVESSGTLAGKGGWAQSVWYAAGVGPVRVRVRTVGVTDLRLRAFTPAK